LEWNFFAGVVSKAHLPDLEELQMSKIKALIPAPNINVTPLIDVLLVLLIIFMVAAPLKPHRFMAKLPSIPHDDPAIQPNIDTLVVTIEADRTLKLNGLSDMGTVDDLSPLAAKLKWLFEERLKNHAYRADMISRLDVSEQQRIEKTVFIKAPRSIPYGEVARVLDGLKGTGAEPIGLQLDNLK
jgi:biopolymer transport protein ExbD